MKPGADASSYIKTPGIRSAIWSGRWCLLPTALSFLKRRSIRGTGSPGDISGGSQDGAVSALASRYFYTKDRPGAETSSPHATVYVPPPLPAHLAGRTHIVRGRRGDAGGADGPEGHAITLSLRQRAQVRQSDRGHYGIDVVQARSNPHRARARIKGCTEVFRHIRLSLCGINFFDPANSLYEFSRGPRVKE